MINDKGRKALKDTFCTKRGLMVNLRYVWVSFFAFMLVGIYALIALNFSFLNPIAQAVKDFSLTDVYYQVLAEHPDTSRAITVVDMSKLYTRTEVAALLYDIEQTRPKVVGVDIVFQDERTDYVGNDMLVDIAKTYDNVVFSYYRQNIQNNEETEVHSFFTDSVKVMEGFTDMPRGLYGVMKRKVPLCGASEDGQSLSFSSLVANRYAEKDIVPLEEADLDINFEPTVFTIVSCDSVLFHPELLEGRIVLVGGINRLEDMHDTPLGKMAGTVLLAYSIQTIIESREVKYLSAFWLGILSFLIVMLTCVWQDGYSRLVDNSIKNLMIQNVLKSTYIAGLLTSFWCVLLLGLAFIVFCKFNISVNLGWAFAAISCLVGSKSLYSALYNTVLSK